MNKLVAICCVLALLLPGCGHKTKTSVTAKRPPGDKRTDWEKSGLAGKIHTVRVYAVDLNTKRGAVVEGRKWLETKKTYQPTGRIAATVSYNRAGKELSAFIVTRNAKKRSITLERRSAIGRSYKQVMKRGPDGRYNETLNYDGNGKSAGRSILHYDASGNVIRQDFYTPDGQSERKLVLGYDAEGNQTTQAWYGADRALVSKTVATFNDRGDMTGYSNCDAKGRMRLAQRVVVTYIGQSKDSVITRPGKPGRERIHSDSKGTIVVRESADGKRASFVQKDAKKNPLMEAQWNPDGSLKYKWTYAYEWDAKGNWTKQTKSELVTRNGKSTLRPVEVKYRKITYY